jgi:hypothetical protein
MRSGATPLDARVSSANVGKGIPNRDRPPIHVGFNKNFSDNDLWPMGGNEFLAGEFDRIFYVYGLSTSSVNGVFQVDSLPSSNSDKEQREQRNERVSDLHVTKKRVPPIAWVFPCACSGLIALYALFNGLKYIGRDQRIGDRIGAGFLLLTGGVLAVFSSFGVLVGDDLLIILGLHP